MEHILITYFWSYHSLNDWYICVDACCYIYINLINYILESRTCKRGRQIYCLIKWMLLSRWTFYIWMNNIFVYIVWLVQRFCSIILICSAILIIFWRANEWAYLLFLLTTPLINLSVIQWLNTMPTEYHDILIQSIVDRLLRQPMMCYIPNHWSKSFRAIGYWFD